MGFVAGDGLICNDCGLIAPRSGINKGAFCRLLAHAMPNTSLAISAEGAEGMVRPMP